MRGSCKGTKGRDKGGKEERQFCMVYGGNSYEMFSVSLRGRGNMGRRREQNWRPGRGPAMFKEGVKGGRNFWLGVKKLVPLC